MASDIDQIADMLARAEIAQISECFTGHDEIHAAGVVFTFDRTGALLEVEKTTK
jgi:hypothetical protein